MSEIKFLYPVEIKVQWGDQDALGHVNNTVFFKYFESARIHMFNETGIWDAFEKSKLYVVLAKIECNFLRSIHYPETVIVQCGISKIGNSSLTIEHQIFTKSDGLLVATGQGIVVCADPIAQKSSKIPEEIKQIIAEQLK
ncbi:MAG TPA: thioesterase family protein [Chitinophagales bacterium]|nr:thioesterase family protein [Chitinophagales bacterium]